MHTKSISINDYTYDLPADKIANHPLEQRDRSKLLVYREGKITSDIYRNIADYLPDNSLLIFNNTKVIQARILFKKETGGVIEIFCLEPYGNKEYTTVMNARGSAEWKCMIGGASKWKKGCLEKKFFIGDEEIIFTASLKEKLPDAYVTEFKWQPAHFSFAEIIEKAGETPLPPYIKRKAVEEDKERYQTIYAMQDGSVAAPTAGLHFTPQIFSSLKDKNIQAGFVTLHVGAGTFKPVKTETIEAHEMHSEWIDVSATTIENVLNNLENIVAVGTTSLRTLESLYWMGVKAKQNPGILSDDLSLKQWEVYEELSKENILTADALSSLLKWMSQNHIERLVTKTQVLIAPGYKFRIVKTLITNFHQPKSTLLLLIAAAIGNDWRKVYQYALENDFRFLSYGDGCLLKIIQ